MRTRMSSHIERPVSDVLIDAVRMALVERAGSAAQLERALARDGLRPKPGAVERALAYLDTTGEAFRDVDGTYRLWPFREELPRRSSLCE